MKVHLNIGSNQGDRHDNLRRAIALIASEGIAVTALSEPMESEPWGFDSANRFVNIGVNIETELTPFRLLDKLQAIERRMSPEGHRNPDGSYRDRVIDIDIIDIEGVTVSTDRLTVPHPRAHMRDFVTIPMAAIWRKVPRL